MIGEYKTDDPERRCGSCGAPIDDYPYELWLFRRCRACAAETNTRDFRDGYYGGSQRKWLYDPQWHRENRSVTIEERDTFEDVVAAARRSHYNGVADVLEHYGNPEPARFGPLYNPFDAPYDDPETAKRLLWAFRAGRAFERERQGETDE